MSEVKISVVIADDHPVVRSGLRALLESEQGIEVVGEADDAEGAARKLSAHKPDVLILDLMMPGGPATSFLDEIRGASERTRVIVLTMHSDPSYARAALRQGASGYMLKEAAQKELISAVREVAGGSTYLDPELGVALAREPDEGPPGGLTQREADVLGLVALGHTNKEIGDRLHLSVRTIEAHRTHIQQKLSFESRAELVRFAIDQGLIET